MADAEGWTDRHEALVDAFAAQRGRDGGIPEVRAFIDDRCDLDAQRPVRRAPGSRVCAPLTRTCLHDPSGPSTTTRGSCSARKLRAPACRARRGVPCVTPPPAPAPRARAHVSARHIGSPSTRGSCSGRKLRRLRAARAARACSVSRRPTPPPPAPARTCLHGTSAPPRRRRGVVFRT